MYDRLCELFIRHLLERPSLAENANNTVLFQISALYWLQAPQTVPSYLHGCLI